MRLINQTTSNHLSFFHNHHQLPWPRNILPLLQFLSNFSSTPLTTSHKIQTMERAVGNLFLNPKISFNAYVETCLSLLKTCSNQGLIKEGRNLHGHLIKTGISSNTYVARKLLNMYLHCKKSDEVDEILAEFGGFDIVAWNCVMTAKFQGGDVREALCLFDEMPERNEVSWSVLIAGLMRNGRVDESMSYFRKNPFHDVVSWTAMINGFVQNGSNFEALKLFREMLECKITPNAITFTGVIKACIGLSHFAFGRSLLGLIVRLGLDYDTSICNSLITLHLRMGEIELARRVFEGMKEKDVVSWTSMLDVYVEMGELAEARRIFDEMPERNDVSWSAMITRYSQSGDTDEALKLFNMMVRDGFKANIPCFSSIISASASLLALQLGMSIHGHTIKLGIDRDVFIGSTLIDMYSKCGKTEDGRCVFDSISARNVVSWNSMISGYTLNGQLEEAQQLFEHIPVRNTVSWNAIISGYIQNENCDKVLEVFGDMLSSGETPNGSTFSSVLRACASLASLEKGKNVHGKIIKLGIQYEVFMGTALTDMYAKSGDIHSSRKVFNRMIEKNEISWTVMIQGLADNGLAEESLFLFEEMERTSAVAPTELVFIVVLFACSHCGLVDKGLGYFESMEKVYGIKPRGMHYTCIVDLLARSGRLNEAEAFIHAMPFQPEANALASLLSACSTYNNEEMAERTVRKLWELADENSAGYVLLSNIYASAGRWSDVLKVRKLMKEKRLKKIGGCSWIEVRNQVHSFYCEDGGHLQSFDIYEILELVMFDMVSDCFG